MTYLDMLLPGDGSLHVPWSSDNTDIPEVYHIILNPHDHILDENGTIQVGGAPRDITKEESAWYGAQLQL